MMGSEKFELYRLLVEEVRETRRARRELANMFTSLNLGGVGALGFLARGDTSLSPALLVFLAVALTLTCVIWRMSNAYYARLLQVKYDVIYDLELALGIDPLQREYAGLSRKGPVRWFSVERAMPILFVAGYVVFMAFSVSLTEVEDMAKAMIRPVLTIVQWR